MSKLKDIVEVVDEVRSKLSSVANKLEELDEPEPAHKTKFLVCKKPKNGLGCGTRYRIKGNSAPCEVEVYSNPDSDGVYIGEHGSPNSVRVYVLGSELTGLRDLLTHLIKKRGVK